MPSGPFGFVPKIKKRGADFIDKKIISHVMKFS